MDLVQENLITLFQTYDSLSPYLRPIHSTVSTIQTQTSKLISPLITPLLESFYTTLSESPAILSIILFVILLFVSLKILDLLRRAVVFWVRLMVKIAFWGTIIALAMAVWQVGFHESVERLYRCWLELRRIWEREYGRWEAVEQRGNARGQKWS